MNNTLLFILAAIGLFLVVGLVVSLSIHKSVESIKDMTRAVYGTDSIEEALALEDDWPNETHDATKEEASPTKNTTTPPLI